MRTSVHVRCPHCKRLLVPLSSGKLPAHRIPPPPGEYSIKSVSLTGTGHPWCRGGSPEEPEGNS